MTMATSNDRPLLRRIYDAATMFVVAFLCVSLLIYIAYGTTKRTYEQLLVDKALAQAELVRNPMETYLRPGLPLRQFTGFNQLTNSMIESDRTLISMVAELSDGELVFSAGDSKIRTLAPGGITAAANSTAELRRSDYVLQIVLPLSNKFERVGNLVVTMDRIEIDKRLSSEFRINLVVALLACFGFGCLVFWNSSLNGSPGGSKSIALAFTAMFMIVAVAIVATMISLFTAGAEFKGRALVDSLGQRLDDIPQYGLQFDQIEGLDIVLDSYRTLNPEISSIGITINGRVAVHTDRQRIGNFWVQNASNAEYIANLTPPNHPRATQVILSVPRNFVFWTVARNVKNYAALFVASALFAFLFMQLAQAVRGAQDTIRSGATDWRSSFALDLVKPVFFLAVFVDNLSYAFLPQVMQDLVRGGSANGPGSIAWPFTAYYLCFALALIPAGHYAQTIGSRKLVVGGLALIVAGLVGMAMVSTLEMAVFSRAATGTGQGILFIGVQTYILAKSQRENRTKANGIIVYGFQGGMISGMAIGSLLAGEIGASGVFVVGAVIATVIIGYTIFMLPKDDVASETAYASKIKWTEMAQLLRNPQFLQIILMVGVPAKAILTGVVLFAMPLLLHGMGFAKEDIGQITMIYAGCVIASSAIAGHLADRSRSCHYLLVWGGLLTALGLFVISLSGHSALDAGPYALVWKTGLIIVGSAVIGWAHGMINAPVVTHITDTAIAARIGDAQTAAVYRLLERSGHMLGPIVVGQMFLMLGTNPIVLGWLGVVMIAFTLIFHIVNPSATSSGHNEEFA